MADRLLAFQATGEVIATPFEWELPRSVLALLLRRLSERDQDGGMVSTVKRRTPTLSNRRIV